MKNSSCGLRLFLQLVILALLPATLLCRPAVQAPSAPPAASTSASAMPPDAEMEKFLRTAKISNIRPIGEGVTRSERATLSDGTLQHDAHIQKIDEYKARFDTPQGVEMNFRDSWKYNIAAYKLDKLLGLNMTPMSVERKVGGSSAAVTWWLDGVTTESDRLRKKMEPPDPMAWNHQMWLVRVFDQLIYNMDRNLGNLLITKDWKIWMIDHTRAFRILHALKVQENLVRCDRKLLERLKAFDKKTLEQALKPYLAGPEIDGLLARRDRIVKRFEELIAQKGEAEILYDYLQ